MGRQRTEWAGFTRIRDGKEFKAQCHICQKILAKHDTSFREKLHRYVFDL